MAYCTSCGAYIPDGQSKCLACGFDEAEQKQKAAETAQASAAARAQKPRTGRQFDSEELRRKLEEQRRRQQENSRKWAETEYAQRQRSQQQRRSAQPPQGATRTNQYTETVRSTVQNADLNKLMAALSYVSFLFVLPMAWPGSDDFTRYHARQGMKLFLAGLIGQILGGILGLSVLALGAQVYLAYLGIKNVLNGRKQPLPYIGELFK